MTLTNPSAAAIMIATANPKALKLDSYTVMIENARAAPLLGEAGSKGLPRPSRKAHRCLTCEMRTDINKSCYSRLSLCFCFSLCLSAYTYIHIFIQMSEVV